MVGHSDPMAKWLARITQVCLNDEYGVLVRIGDSISQPILSYVSLTLVL